MSADDTAKTVAGSVSDAAYDAVMDAVKELRDQIAEFLDAAFTVQDDLHRLSPSDSDDEKLGDHGRDLVSDLRADILGVFT